MPFVNSERPHLHSFITIGNFIPCSDPLCFALNPSLYQFHSVLHTVHAYGCMSSTEVMAPIYITPACLASKQAMQCSIMEDIELYSACKFPVISASL